MKFIAVSVLILISAIPAFGQSHTYTFPIFVQDSRIYVQARVNDRPVLLLADTGTTTSAFDLTLVPKHSKLDELTIRTATGSGKSGVLPGTIVLTGHADGSDIFSESTFKGQRSAGHGHSRAVRERYVQARS